MTIIYAILIFCVLIFVHEFGHFIAAKACGVKVNEFSIGMGPAFFKKQKGETLYSLRIFPIGGFCAMEGEDEDSNDERAFNRKPAWQRAVVLAAGAFMNLLTAVILMIIIAFWSGQATTVVDEVLDDSPAYEAGLQSGDEIVAVNDSRINDWNDILAAIGGSKADSVELTVERNGRNISVTSAIEYDEEAGRSKVGIKPVVRHNIIESIGTGIKNTGNMTVMMYDIIKELITGGVSAKELSGPVGIVYAVNDTAKAGIIYVVYLSALLSLNLAIMNMLPFPALDGGRLLFLLIRKITGKRVTDEMEGKIHFIGIVLLMALMVYVTWNDIVKFIVPLFS
ncbi:RIP metalloprotease RseP [Mogibacterium sp. NSJ-24]|jgi:regulator of sigma E protease|uniref:Zinc metalloprotease n=1 Tax=Lentihominibacter hominis TaxID=2763645 RepID=A0A926E8D8_9FIRM|nr:RIP metalloprotease RseP [Lentihominibacter hominis]MBC8567162.1 RIP metalloprotease RseP [Lentihominibacter hominis]